MKNRNPLLSIAWLFAGLFTFLIVTLAHGQATAAAPAAAALAAPPPVEVPNFILQFLTNLIATSPKVATLVGLLGTMRLWAKPVFSIVHQVIDMTPSTADDAFLGKITNFFAVNPIGRIVAYLLDYATSIKIVPIQPKSDGSPGTPRAAAAGGGG